MTAAAIPMPVPTPSAPPPRMDAHQISRLRAAAAHARRAVPGPLGELAARELLAHAELGYRGSADALLPRLAQQVLALPVTAEPVPTRPVMTPVMTPL